MWQAFLCVESVWLDPGEELNLLCLLQLLQQALRLDIPVSRKQTTLQLDWQMSSAVARAIGLSNSASSSTSIIPSANPSSF